MLRIFIKAFIKGIGNASGGIITLFTAWQIMKLFKIQKYIDNNIDNANNIDNINNNNNINNNTDNNIVDIFDYEIQDYKSIKI